MWGAFCCLRSFSFLSSRKVFFSYFKGSVSLMNWACCPWTNTFFFSWVLYVALDTSAWLYVEYLLLFFPDTWRAAQSAYLESSSACMWRLQSLWVKHRRLSANEPLLILSVSGMVWLTRLSTLVPLRQAWLYPRPPTRSHLRSGSMYKRDKKGDRVSHGTIMEIHQDQTTLKIELVDWLANLRALRRLVGWSSKSASLALCDLFRSSALILPLRACEPLLSVFHFSVLLFTKIHHLDFRHYLSSAMSAILIFVLVSGLLGFS